jgi:hypothetical protein
MDVNATIDVGKNLTSLLERLAQQIGTTADKVFPWYVQQAQLEGATTLIGIVVCVCISLILFAAFFRSADFSDSGFNKYAAMSLLSLGIGFVSLVAIPLEGIDAARKMMNPNYYAMKMLTQDIGRLTAR